jgi:NDP-sugar pyrophosphorylase family protein
MLERRAIILAGGEGSRLRPFTFVIPKPLIPIGEYPIIEILIRQLAHQGFSRVTIAVGHHAALIQSFCGDGARWHIAVDYLHEEEPLGTAGCLAMLGETDVDRFLVVNGDTLTDMDMAGVHDRHVPSDAMTVCSRRRDLAFPFGVIDRDSDGRLTGYAEKPVFSYDVSMGIYVVLTRALRAYLPEPEPIDMPDLVHRLLAHDEAVRVYPSDDCWLDVGHLDDLEAAVAAIQADRERFIPG